MAREGLGILGGTFDPVHLGHLHMAEAVYEKLQLEEVLFVPAYVAPHKVGLEFAPAEERFAMTRLAVKQFAHFSVSDIEISRSGISYTIDTVRELSRIYSDRKLYFIIGADSVVQLHTWNNIYDLLELATFVAAGRPGYAGVKEQVIANLGHEAAEKIVLLDTPEYDISSTDIRSRIRSGASLAGLVPPEVEEYIRKHGLYR